MKNSILLILAFVAVAAHAATTNLTGVVTFERNDLSFFFIDDAAGSHWRVQGEERKIAHNFAGTILLILQEAVGNAIDRGTTVRIALPL